MPYKGLDVRGETSAVVRDLVPNEVIRQKIEFATQDAGSDSAVGVGYVRQGTATPERVVSELFKRLRDSVYRYLVVVLQDPSVAEEITQDVFLELYCCLRDRKTIKNVRAWVFRVAHNLALNEKARMRFADSGEPVTRGGLRLRVESDQLDPEQTILEQERMDLAIQLLSRNQRECLILRVEGFRYREIAEILGLSVPNVAQSLRRGMKKLMRVFP
jgi:RNA polymerase sigma-70 factor (ECF subfamily)